MAVGTAPLLTVAILATNELLEVAVAHSYCCDDGSRNPRGEGGGVLSFFLDT